MLQVGPRERDRLEHLAGTTVADVPMRVDPAGADRAGGAGAAALTTEGEVVLRSNRDLPGTLRGDLLFAHETAHALQQRQAGSPASAQALEGEANRFAVRFADPQRPQPMRLSAAGPLRLQRCDTATVPADLATLSPADKAAVVRRLLDEDKPLVDRAVVEVFRAAAEAGQFVALQEHLDMTKTFNALEDWPVVQIGALGPVIAGTEVLTRCRGEVIRETEHEYSLPHAQIFTLFIIDTTQDDQVRDLLRWLAADNRYNQTIGKMPVVKERLTARGIDPASFTDRPEGVGDVVRAIGGSIGDFFGSSEAAKGFKGSKYGFRSLDLPQNYQAALTEIDKAILESALSPGNVALGVFDQLTFGLPLGLASLVSSTVSGIINLTKGEYDQGTRELFPALVVVGVYVGIRVAPKLTGGGAGGATARPSGGAATAGKARLTLNDLLAQLADDTRVGFAGLRLAYADVDLVRGARYLQRNSKAAAFVERNGQAGFRALVDANGEVPAANRLLAAAAKPKVGGTPVTAPVPSPKSAVAPAAAAAAAGAAVARSTSTEKDEPEKPAPPFRWDAAVEGENALKSGGVFPGALDYNWKRDSGGATIYRQRLTFGGRPYDVDSAKGVKWHGHHSWPKNIGGREEQPVMTVRHSLHLSVLHPALYAYLRAQGHAITDKTSHPLNTTFIARLRSEAAHRRRVRDELMLFYGSLNKGTSPPMPTDAYRLGVADSFTALGG